MSKKSKLKFCPLWNIPMKHKPLSWCPKLVHADRKHKGSWLKTKIQLQMTQALMAMVYQHFRETITLGYFTGWFWRSKNWSDKLRKIRECLQNKLKGISGFLYENQARAQWYRFIASSRNTSLDLWLNTLYNLHLFLPCGKGSKIFLWASYKFLHI